jgi:hypothetical protein
VREQGSDAYTIIRAAGTCERLSNGDHSGHRGAGGSDAAMPSAASLCGLPATSASVRHVS